VVALADLVAGEDFAVVVAAGSGADGKNKYLESPILFSKT
jgi:hypothetical protein